MTAPLPRSRPSAPSTRPTGSAGGDLGRAVREGLDGLEAGEFVSDEDVWAWVDRWDTDGELPVPKPRVASPRRS